VGAYTLGAGVGSAPNHQQTLQYNKIVFLSRKLDQNMLFFRKKLKNRRNAPKYPLASGGWAPLQTLISVLIYYCNFEILNLLLMSHKNFCLQVQEYPSYATGNMTSLNVTSFSPPQCFFWRRHCHQVISNNSEYTNLRRDYL